MSRLSFFRDSFGWAIGWYPTNTSSNMFIASWNYQHSAQLSVRVTSKVDYTFFYQMVDPTPLFPDGKGFHVY